MKNILIVDPLHGDTHQELLRRFGFPGARKTGARTALEQVRKGRSVDLVITELELEDRDGIEFVADLRKSRPDLPVIIVTEQGSIETYLKAASLGVVEYLNKPVLKNELRRIVNLALDSGPTFPRAA